MVYHSLYARSPSDESTVLELHEVPVEGLPTEHPRAAALELLSQSSVGLLMEHEQLWVWHLGQHATSVVGL